MISRAEVRSGRTGSRAVGGRTGFRAETRWPYPIPGDRRPAALPVPGRIRTGPGAATGCRPRTPAKWAAPKIHARERELGTAAEQLRTQIDELATRLRELDEEIENLAVARKTLLALPPTTPEPAEEWPVLPAHPAYQQILDVFADAAGPMRARDLCQALDLSPRPKNIESTRHKLKRPVGLGVLAETEPGLFIQRRP
ncbi:hypothetical protein OG599_31325 [Streptomyces sp. NBC_01335]|uniref:hypothetical protein n=1 Tax=Streptomyces sp. NBC_01335 TaxID=2903828 RepID=UPI002E11A4B0|nr:hypothetical protein OG599_31325 [Streptomyces sp. NBC_01335]